MVEAEVLLKAVSSPVVWRGPNSSQSSNKVTNEGICNPHVARMTSWFRLCNTFLGFAFYISDFERIMQPNLGVLYRLP